MLPRESRLRTAADFAAVIKAGRRAGTRLLVVHALVEDRPSVPQAGFVVSGKVGNSVVRHRVTRRLRPLVRAQLAVLAPGTAVVVRALPAAAVATSGELGADLRSGLTSALRKATSGRTPVRGSSESRVTPAESDARITAGRHAAQPATASKGRSA